jgi:hypothetical protein
MGQRNDARKAKHAANQLKVRPVVASVHVWRIRWRCHAHAACLCRTSRSPFHLSQAALACTVPPQHGDRLMRAINLCDQFISSARADSLGALEVLKGEVRRALLAPPASSACSKTNGVAARPGKGGSRPGSLGPSRPPTASSQVGRHTSRCSLCDTYTKRANQHHSPMGAPDLQASKRSSQLDWTLPNQLLEARAFVRGDPFGAIVKRQASCATARCCCLRPSRAAQPASCPALAASKPFSCE